MIWVPISHSSRGSTALTLPWVPTDMKTGVSTTPWGVVNRPRRALDVASVFSSSNMAARVYYGPDWFNCKNRARPWSGQGSTGAGARGRRRVDLEYQG